MTDRIWWIPKSYLRNNKWYWNDQIHEKCESVSRLVVSGLFMTPWILSDFSAGGILQGRILDWVALPFSRESSPLKDQGSPALQADSLPSESPGKPNKFIFNLIYAIFYVWCPESI